MGLDSFDSGDEERSTERPKQVSEYGRKKDLNLKLCEDTDKEYYNTRATVAIQLYRAGFDVRVDETITIESGDTINVDILALNHNGIDSALNMRDVHSVIVNIGEYTQLEATDALSASDIVLLIDEGNTLSDAVVIRGLYSNHDENYIRDVYDYSVVREDNKTPSLHNLHVNRYLDMMKEILISYDDLDTVSDMCDYINENTEYTTDDGEVMRVLSEIDLL